MKKIYLVIISLVASLNFVNAQDDLVFQPENKIDYSLELGTGVSLFNGNTLMYNFVAPQFNYSVKNNIIVSAGIMVLNLNTIKSNNENNQNSSFMNTYLYAGVTYLVNEKLSVNGKIIYSDNMLLNRQNNNTYKPQTYSIGAKYKFSDSFSVGVQFSNSSYNNNNLFGNSYLYGY